ncbi:Chloroperoxidase [Hysterangium stoloniferum]|nr:Chloroperoxidase [Hysterangium stoloniferum]
MSVADSTSSQPVDVPAGPNDQGVHAYQPPNGALRSPCPALNTLSNHSYLPHDGKNITFSKIVTALQEGFGLSYGFAIFMAIGTYTLLQRPYLSLIDLKEASLHDYIEHDASMVHDDTPPGKEYAPIQVNINLLRSFLRCAHPSSSSSSSFKGLFVVNTYDIAKCRVQREADCCHQLDTLHAELARAEFAMVQEIFGHGRDKEVTDKDMEIFLGEERFPPGWKPDHVLHLWDAVGRATEIREAMAKLKEAEGHLEEKPEGWEEKMIENLKAAVGHIIERIPALPLPGAT